MGHDAGHIPVLVERVVELLARSGAGVIVDATVGLGGHAEALLASLGPETRLIGLDVDEANLRRARDRLAPWRDRVRLFQANFARLPEVLAEADTPRVDALLADLGVASTHLDEPERGFSFLHDGPVDMRMDPRIETTAGDLIARLGEAELADVIYRYGEERFSRRIARAIIQRRRREPIRSTLDLARVVAGAIPAAARAKRRGVHPATRTFQALRIAVNDELGSLEALLGHLPEVLCDGGRAAIISFHSLEDRLVKRAFADRERQGLARRVHRKPITADDREAAGNPRSRSAKMRVLERTPRA
jgi:16S rRNA (cytosine1402-N4)-methyltransferase